MFSLSFDLKYKLLQGNSKLPIFAFIFLQNACTFPNAKERPVVTLTKQSKLKTLFSNYQDYILLVYFNPLIILPASQLPGLLFFFHSSFPTLSPGISLLFISTMLLFSILPLIGTDCHCYNWATHWCFKLFYHIHSNNFRNLKRKLFLLSQLFSFCMYSVPFSFFSKYILHC
jgi:hypothetical protein